MDPWPVRLIDWLTWSETGYARGRILTLVILALSLTATVGQALAYPHADTTVDFARGMSVLLAINALIGLVIALSGNPFALVTTQPVAETDAALHAFVRVWAYVGLSLAVQVLVGIPLTSVFGTGEWTTVFSPLLFGAALPLVAQLLALLAGWLVLWPLILLAQGLWMLVAGRRADSAVAAASVISLTVAALAVTAALGTDYFDRGDRGRVLAIVRLWTDQTGDPLTLSFRWVARSLMALLVLELVLVAAAVNARRAARRDRA